jgi:hypothetical protein
MTFPQHRLSNSDNIRSGNAVAPDRSKLGIPLTGTEAQSVYVLSLGAPTLPVANNVALSQAVGAGAPFILNGALVSGGVATFDVPRNIVAAWTTVSIITITGYDVYGQLMVEIAPSGSSFVGKKAFKRVTSVVSSAAITAATLGTGGRLGLPYRPSLGGFIRGRFGEDTADAGVYTAPERVTMTGASNDVRGTYAPASTLDGVTVVTVVMASLNGPDNVHAFGLAQFAG